MTKIESALECPSGHVAITTVENRAKMLVIRGVESSQTMWVQTSTSSEFSPEAFERVISEPWGAYIQHSKPLNVMELRLPRASSLNVVTHVAGRIRVLGMKGRISIDSPMSGKKQSVVVEVQSETLSDLNVTIPHGVVHLKGSMPSAHIEARAKRVPSKIFFWGGRIGHMSVSATAKGSVLGMLNAHTDIVRVEVPEVYALGNLGPIIPVGKKSSRIQRCRTLKECPSKLLQIKHSQPQRLRISVDLGSRPKG